MNHTSYFMAMLTDEAVWEQLQILLQEYDPEMREKHAAYISALDAMAQAGADADALQRAIRGATISDALFAFQKGLECNLYHFRHPYVPSFAGIDFDDMFQENVMMLMPKRVEAEKVIDAIRSENFQEDAPWYEAINEYIIDLEVTVPKLMHFEGYLFGIQWFRLTVPGYQEDQALTSIYHIQIERYFGK